MTSNAKCVNLSTFNNSVRTSSIKSAEKAQLSRKSTLDDEESGDRLGGENKKSGSEKKAAKKAAIAGSESQDKG